MYTQLERLVVDKAVSAVPPIYREQRAQFAATLPMLALLSVVLMAIFGGWLGLVLSVLQLLVVSPLSIIGLIFTLFFWIELLPPILWAASYLPLQKRRLTGWRFFTAATILSLFASIASLNLIGVLFSLAILYFTVQCYDEFSLRY